MPHKKGFEVRLAARELSRYLYQLTGEPSPLCARLPDRGAAIVLDHRIAAGLKLDAVQLHGHESEEFSRGVPLPVIKALRVRDVESLSPIDSYPARAFLLDAYVEGLPGGTGTRVPWELAVQAKGRVPIILSGGLRPENVEEAIRLVRPFAVDVSSGVERSPGQKDHRKVREFIVNVRHADLG